MALPPADSARGSRRSHRRAEARPHRRQRSVPMMWIGMKRRRGSERGRPAGAAGQARQTKKPARRGPAGAITPLQFRHLHQSYIVVKEKNPATRAGPQERPGPPGKPRRQGADPGVDGKANGPDDCEWSGHGQKSLPEWAVVVWLWRVCGKSSDRRARGVACPCWPRNEPQGLNCLRRWKGGLPEIIP